MPYINSYQCNNCDFEMTSGWGGRLYITDEEGVRKVADFCEKNLNLEEAALSEEYFYQSLPLCVIDAVWSIGVSYKHVRNVVKKYCNYFSLSLFRENRNELPRKEEQESISDFINKKEELGIEKFTEEIFNNRQRTSSRNGILKTEAVFRFAEALKNYNVEYLQDVGEIVSNEGFEWDIKKIPGQGSGISLKMFFMLAGNNDLIKPDRHIHNFLRNALSKRVSDEYVQKTLTEVVEVLKPKYPDLNARLLDHEIWKYQSI